MATVLYTIGSRDVQVRAGEPEADEENSRLQRQTREAGAAALQRWQDAVRNKDAVTQQRLCERYEIAQLSAAAGRVIAREQRIDRLYLIVSDQPESEPRRGSDTLYAGELAAGLLRAAYPAQEQRIKQIEVVPLKGKSAGIDPSDYGACFEFLRTKLAGLKIPDDDRVYLCPTSGTPAMTMGLILAGLLTAQTRAHLLYLGQGEQRPRQADFPYHFLRALRRRDLEALLSRRDYVAAAMGLREAGAAPWLVAIAESAAARLNFDFATALRGLEDAEAAMPANARAAFGWFRTGVEHLAEAGVPVTSNLAELHVQLGLLWDAGRYLDFAGRAVLFLENAAGLVVERGLDLPEGGKRGHRLMALVEGPRARPELVTFIDKERLSLPSIADKSGNMSTYAMVRLFAFIVSGENVALAGLPQAEADGIRAVVDVLKRLDRIRDMRNESVHNFGGIGREDLVRAYGADIDALPAALLSCIETLAALDAQANDAIRGRISGWPAAVNALILRWFDTAAA